MTPWLTPDQCEAEKKRIIVFLRHHLGPDGRAVIGLSGGLDADVVARLTVAAIGPQRVKLFTVRQAGLEEKFVENARRTAAALGVHLVEIDLAVQALDLIATLAAADPVQGFLPAGLLDPARAKSALRTAVHTVYVERGYTVVGTSNRTEWDIGFFLSLGDGVWHLGPIAHLYKSQVYDLAGFLGCAEQVIGQAPSAGFWPGETDLEDIAFWLAAGEPIREDRIWGATELETVQRMAAELSFAKIDTVLCRLAGQPADADLVAASGLSPEAVQRLRQLVAAADRHKKKPLRVALPPSGRPDAA